MKIERILFWAAILLSMLTVSCSEDSTLNADENVVADEFKSSNQANRIKNKLVYDWTEKFLELDRYATGMRPNATARALAYISLASYETALPTMRNKASMSRTLDGLRITGRAPRNLQVELALNRAFAKTIDHFLINLPTVHRNKIGQFEKK